VESVLVYIYIGTDNDSTWPLIIKEAWPYYANGMSKAWLTMVDDCVKEVCRNNFIEYPLLPFDALKKESRLDRIMLYNNVSKRMGGLWMDYGKHAFFHHISVLFGGYSVNLKVTL